MYDKNGTKLTLMQILDSINDEMILLDKVKRIEIIDDDGRAFVTYVKKVELSVQDNSGTLKLITKK